MKITIEHLEFPLSVKDKITKIPKMSKLHFNRKVNGKVFKKAILKLLLNPYK